MKTADNPKVYIIVLNYQHWSDTLECLESVLQADYSNYSIVVVDNNSSNQSMEKIKAWAAGKNEKGRMIFLQSNENLGFAGGNNLGIKYALERGDCGFVWILNNDVVVSPGTLSSMVRCLQKNDRAGICGSKIVNYQNPEIIQALAGRFRKWYGKNEEIKDKGFLAEKDYIIGTSMLITSKCIEEAGLLPEDYFLYFEEADYCRQAVKLCFELVVDLEAVVLHKDGISSSGILKEYYYTRNLLHFTKKHFSLHLIFALRYIMLHRLPLAVSKGKWQQVKYLLLGVWAFFTGEKGRAVRKLH